jgi:hypothetical protein
MDDGADEQLTDPAILRDAGAEIESIEGLRDASAAFSNRCVTVLDAAATHGTFQTWPSACLPQQ